MEEVRKALIDLAKTIPKDVSFFYGKRDMKPYRAQIDKTVAKLLQYDERARKADRKFYSQIKSCPNDSFCEDLEAEYFLRQRNLVLRAVKKIKSEIYERKGQYKVNDNNLKRRLAISHRKVDKLIDGFLSSFGEESEYLSRDYTNRLQEIEEEMETEQERQKEQEARASRYNYSKE